MPGAFLGSAVVALALPIALVAQYSAPARLENSTIQVTVDPGHGGAVTKLWYKKAFTFPLIADKGSGVAGSGMLFAPTVEIGGVPADWSPVRVVRAEPGLLVLQASFPGIAPRLAWERRMHLGDEESEFSVEDVLRNDSSRDLAVRIGSSSRQEAEAWRFTDRSWIGNETSSREQHIPATRETTLSGSFSKGAILPPPALLSARLESSGPRVFWRQIEQYGTGFLYRIGIPGSTGVMTAVNLPETGAPRRVEWRSGELILRSHSRVTCRSEVLLDEGGGKPDQRNAFASVLVCSDFAAAGRSGERLIGFATVVSPRARRVRLAVATGHDVASADYSLLPGKVARLPVAFAPPSKGELAIRASASENGREIGAATSQALIDGDPGNPIWMTYTRRMPEEHYHGSWEEIGGELALNRHLIGTPTSFEIVAAKNASEEIDQPFFARHLPFVTEMLAGAAKALGVAPSQLAIVQRSTAESAHCMDVACYGPDGPINAFSKERDGPYFQGLGYVKVSPKQGYRFHLFQHQGINSEGLSITGADLNADQHTKEVAARHLAEWRRAGKQVMPYLTVGKWLLLATCRDVGEALTMIQNPEVPLDFSGNMLLMDRAGNSARVESMDLDRQIFRAAAQPRGFFVAGNYPHPRADGLFQIGRWQEAANTMLREEFLRDYEASRQGSLGLTETMELMQCHEAGGMCQHFFDNPGQYYSTACFIAVNRTGDLYLSEGPPCEVQYVRYTLDP